MADIDPPVAPVAVSATDVEAQPDAAVGDAEAEWDRRGADAERDAEAEWDRRGIDAERDAEAEWDRRGIDAERGIAAEGDRRDADSGAGADWDRGNADVEWDNFDSVAYFEHNYGTLREDDQKIIQIVAEFFATEKRKNWFPHAIDVGSGTNLYPALMMLPYSPDVTLFERAHSNRQWLKNELSQPSKSWLDFWYSAADGRTPYQPIGDPLDLLHRRARVSPGNVFALAADRYDIGTMFFVAESITTRADEFRRAVRQFVNSLKPGSPFAAAFMRDSSGYYVGKLRFPACSIDIEDVKEALEPVARNVKVSPVESNDLRPGYCGMMVATGFKR